MATMHDEDLDIRIDEGGFPRFDEGVPDAVLPPPIIPPDVVVLGAVWTWVLGEAAPSNVERRELTEAVGRVLTMRVDDASSAVFTLDGRSEEAAEIVALATDLHIYRDGIKLFRGRIVTESDSIGSNSHEAKFSAIDYRGMLNFRIVGAGGRTFVGVDQGDIAWQLISESQALPGGNWGITNGLGAVSGVVRDRTYDPGKPIGDLIAELGRVLNGFEWNISVDMQLDRWYPYRGSVTGARLDFGGNVIQVERSLIGRDFADSVMAIGSQGMTPIVATSATVATDPRGLWELSASFTTVLEQSTLDTKASWTLDRTNALRPELAVTLTPGTWGRPASINPGDFLPVSVRSGRLNDAAVYRAAEIEAAPGQHGTETIRMGLVSEGLVV